MNRVLTVFDELASSWDEKHGYIEGVYEGESERLLKCAASYVQDGMRVADLGCGTGKVTEHILKLNKNVEVVAVDGSREMVEVASEKFYEFDNVHCINSDLEQFCDDEAFDIIFLAQVIHHLDNPRNAMGHITKLLKPNGIIILMVIGEEHMCSVVPYNESNDVLGRFDKRKLLDLFTLDSQSYCRIFDDHFKMAFNDMDDFNNFMAAVSLTPKMNGYEIHKNENIFHDLACDEGGSLLVGGHYYTLIYKKDSITYNMSTNFKETVINAYNEWSENYNSIVLDKLERRGYGYDDLADVIRLKKELEKE